MYLRILLATLAICLLRAAPTAQAQTLARQFTYQGYLENSGTPYTGNAAVTFTLYNAATGGAARATVVVPSVAVSKGVFSTLVNFGVVDTLGAPIYDGRPLFMDVSVAIGTNNTLLTPRQAIQPAPYALSMPNITAIGTNIGIGTPTPAATLDVNGETRSSTVEVTAGSISKGGTTPATTDLGLYALNSGEWLRMVSNNGPIHFFTNSTQGAAASPTTHSAAMTIAANGSVGLGTSAPTTKLDVVGTIRHASDATANPARTFDISSGGAIDLVGNSDIYMNSRGGRKFLLLNTDVGAGNVGIGTADPTEKLHVNGNIRAKVIIIEGGADLAESYDVAAAGEVQPTPGMVVCIDPDRVGKLRISTTSCDRTVAGIISGADGVAPGLVLGHKGTIADGQHPIANVGRVWCLVDADAGGPVVAGDLLTTSATAGHAMKVSDNAKSSGAVIGKAMSSLRTGKGMVLVLVTLQ